LSGVLFFRIREVAEEEVVMLGVEPRNGSVVALKSRLGFLARIAAMPRSSNARRSCRRSGTESIHEAESVRCVRPSLKPRP